MNTLPMGTSCAIAAITIGTACSSVQCGLIGDCITDLVFVHYDKEGCANTMSWESSSRDEVRHLVAYMVASLTAGGAVDSQIICHTIDL
jgi:hypothetical protein